MRFRIRRFSLRRPRAFHLFGRAEGGVSAVEFAVLLPFVIYLVIGVVDFGMGVYLQMEVKQAAQVGAEYVVAANKFDQSAISNAIVQSTSLSGVSASPEPADFCACVADGAFVNVACDASCGDGTGAGYFVTVSSSAKYTPMLRYPLVANRFALSGQATVRLR